ncbi:winged helix-turn-helix domain-containing protein [Paraburkholderia phosphatilytica]|uniref:winged helix-turn-helix domain-containing protein n=1 Tax=Paraburkholderia phosphatilytica TaxID=2282883 RepID=UPI000E4677F7|nr:winged helix-turn-helix domain-containing protein [Paraburkholderia phosphatilytica]
MSSTQSHSLQQQRDSGAAHAQRVRILNLLNDTPQGLTRADIARQTGFALSSVCGRVGELIESGHAENSAFTTTDPLTLRTVRPVVAIFPGA